MLDAFIYQRPDLAASFLDRLTGPLGHGKPLLLFGPRRIGKTTFLRNDLLPALVDKGLQPLYVNLWSNRAMSPVDLLERAIDEAVAPGWFRKALAKVRKVGAAGFQAEFADDRAKVEGTVAALKELVDHVGKPVVLVIDEAQQALATPEGQAFMYALKTAWEELNQGKSAIGTGPRLLIVMTGSARDKLSRLAVPKGSPFFGAAVPEEFPSLPDAFALQYAEYVNRRVADRLRLDPQQVARAFDRLGRKAEMLFRLITSAADRMTSDLDPLTKKMLSDLAQQADVEYRETLNGLTDLQIAVLRRIGQRKPVFSQEALQAYTSAVGEKINPNDAQTAAQQLRALGLVWNAARGHYEIEDQGFEQWLAEHPELK
jgi:hypothetical protein